MNTSELLGLFARTLSTVDADLSVAARMCRACVTVLGAQGGTLTLSAGPGEQLTVTTSDRTAAEIESLQEVLGEGPGRQALLDDRIVVAPLRDAPVADDEFPVFSHLAGTVGGPAWWYAVPVRVAGQAVGVLGLYVTAEHLARGLEDAQFLADAVGTAVLADADQLGGASRARVQQAMGMVAALLRIPPPDALVVLRAHAFSEGVTLQDVADAVVSRRLTFTDDADALETRTEDS